MKRNTIFALMAVLLLSAALATVTIAAPADGASVGKTVYTCACGDACPCNTVAAEPGKCSCGKELMERTVLKVDAENIYVCNCGAKCKCTGVSADGAKCSCGKELRAFPKADKVGCACCRKNGAQS